MAGIHSLINRLLRGRWVLVSHYMNPKLILIHAVVQKVNGQILIVDPHNYYASLLGRLGEEPRENTIIVDKYIAGGYGHVILVEPGEIPWIREYNALATLTPNTGIRVPRIYKKAWIKKAGDTYQLMLGGEEARFKISRGGIIDYGGLSEAEEKALEILRNAMIEYGELTTHDAAVLLSAELGLQRQEARRIMSRLVEKKYLSIRKGYLNL